MATATDLQTGLAYDIEGTGTPVVFLHGLTFDRRTWRPVIDQLDGSVTSIAIDLPAHGDSGGEPAPPVNVTEQIHRLLETLGVERPVVAGHSMGAAVAGVYTSAHPARGIVLVDQATEVLPFAQMLHQIAPLLRGPAFDQVWANIENSLGLDRIPEPARTLVLDTHKVKQDDVRIDSAVATVLRTALRRDLVRNSGRGGGAYREPPCASLPIGSRTCLIPADRSSTV
jgi:pimeloyl-ACP methyl ester carboxylesterase